jgi:hypothetical protein
MHTTEIVVDWYDGIFGPDGVDWHEAKEKFREKFGHEPNCRYCREYMGAVLTVIHSSGDENPVVICYECVARLCREFERSSKKFRTFRIKVDFIRRFQTTHNPPRYRYNVATKTWEKMKAA